MKTPIQVGSALGDFTGDFPNVPLARPQAGSGRPWRSRPPQAPGSPGGGTVWGAEGPRGRAAARLPCSLRAGAARHLLLSPCRGQGRPSPTRGYRWAAYLLGARRLCVLVRRGAGAGRPPGLLRGLRGLLGLLPRALTAATRPRLLGLGLGLGLGLRVRLPGGVAVLHGGGLAEADPAEQVAH